jgi:hypothetical protein
MKGSAAPTAVALALLAGAAHAATYYVDNTCTSAGSGTSQTCNTSTGPFRTIAAAMSASLAPGDTIRVRATGTPYAEATIATSKAGTAAQPITLTSYAATPPVWSGSSGERLRVEHAWWVIDNFEFAAGGSSDVIRVRAPGVTFRNCELHGSSGDGFSVGQGADNLTIDGCHIHDMGGGGDNHGIVTGKESGDGTDYTLTGLTVINSTFNDIGGDGIQLFEESDACREATVTGRIENNVFVMGTQEGHENAIDVKTMGLASDPLVIAGNDISGWDGSTTAEGSKPVVVQHCSDHVHFIGNVVKRGSGSGSCDPCFGLVVSASTASAASPVVGVRIVGNTFVGQERAMQLGEGSSATALAGLEVYHNTAWGLGDAMFRIAGPIQGQFKNNLVQGQVLSCSSGGSLSAVVRSNNGWFGSSSEQTSCSGSCGSLCHATDTVGSSAGFVDPAAGDFNLAAGSPAIDRGANVGLPFNGAAPDLGSHESGGTGSGSGEPPSTPTNVVAF